MENISILGNFICLGTVLICGPFLTPKIGLRTKINFFHVCTGHHYPTIWQAYLAVVATLFSFNINKNTPVHYHPPHTSTVAFIDYNNKELYTLH